MTKPIKTFVINLDRTIDNYNRQLPYLLSLGLDVHRFRGVDGKKNEHLQYRHIIDSMYYNFVCTSTLSISLSHILVSTYITELIDKNDNNDPYFLIMEDDAYPLYNRDTFQSIIDKTVSDIESFDKNWDIILLHEDNICNTYINKCDDFSYNIQSSSTSFAAYLVSRSGALKISTEKDFFYNLDKTTSNKKYKKYKTKVNLFFTNETTSDNRSTIHNSLSRFIEDILNRFFIIKGEKKWNDILNYKVMKVPLIDCELTNIHIIVLIGIIVFYILYIYL
jgi:GR25 family glycosyltransferase involved in LPS biosynthesis